MFKDSIYYRLRARKTMLFYAAVFFVVLLLVAVGFLAYKGRKSAKAVDFQATTSKLVVPEGTLLYIGAPGYVSQRIYNNVAEPINPTHSLPAGAAVPANHVYNTSWSYIPCPAASVWGQSFSGCRSMIGDGSGMILKYSSSIEVYGTVIIGDRVAFEAPTINIYDHGKIYANGQDNQAGYHDKSCGTGGIGGNNGGTNASTLDVFDSHDTYITVPEAEPGGAIYVVEGAKRTVSFTRCPGANTTGGPSTNSSFPEIVKNNVLPLNDDVRLFFSHNGETIRGGNGSDGSLPIEGSASSGTGALADVGVGGGGAGGSTGSTNYDDHATSGGGGGGFGIVFKASGNFLVSSSAEITVAGGNSVGTSIGTAIYTDGSPDSSGGFGGPGGGGVIIIDSASVNFTHTVCRGPWYDPCRERIVEEAEPNYSIFNTKAGTLVFPKEYDIKKAGVDRTIKTPPGAEIGKLIVNTGSSISVKKSLQNLGSSDGGLRPNYVFRPGDEIIVTLNVSNLVPGQSVQIKDEIYSDGIHISTVVPGTIFRDNIVDGSVNGAEVVWNFTPTSSQAVLKYNLKVN